MVVAKRLDEYLVSQVICKRAVGEGSRREEPLKTSDCRSKLLKPGNCRLTTKALRGVEGLEGQRGLEGVRGLSKLKSGEEQQFR